MDFLTFKSFISIDVLIVFYNIGAIIVPFFAWLFAIWVINKYDILNLHKKFKWNILRTKDKVYIIFSFIFAFLLMEIFWRMMFEFLIAYMQIRDALVH